MVKKLFHAIVMKSMRVTASLVRLGERGGADSPPPLHLGAAKAGRNHMNTQNTLLSPLGWARDIAKPDQLDF
jgi:hypothetical protein